MQNIYHLKPETDPVSILREYLVTAGTSRVVLLAEGQVMVRRLRRLVQQTGVMPAPTIMTDSAWLEEQILLNAPAKVLPKKVLNPQQFAWFVQHVIHELGDSIPPVFRSPDGLKSVLRWLSSLAAEHIPISDSLMAFEGSEHEAFPRILNAISRELAKNRFVPRGFVGLLANSISSVAAMPDVVIRWEPSGLPVSKTYVFERFQKLAPKTNWISVLTAVHDEKTPEKAREFVRNHPEKVISVRPHDEEAELEFIFRTIAKNVLEKKKPVGNHLILCQDLESYRALAMRLSHETGVPLYISKGAKLSSLPLIRRFFVLFELLDDLDDVDALVQVFGDQLLSIGAYSGIKTELPPKIREFSDFSRKHNTRTLEESRQLPARGVDSRGLIETVLAHTDAFKNRFSTRNSRLASQWFGGFIPQLLNVQSALGGEIAGNLRNTLVGISENLAEELEALGLDEKIAWRDALDLLRETVTNTSEPSPEIPDAVLMTEPSFMTLTRNATVFIPGVKEGTWPSAEPTDFLRYTWKEQAENSFPDRIGDFWQLTVNRFSFIAESAAVVYVTCPKFSGSREVSPSPLFVELQIEDRKPPVFDLPEIRSKRIIQYEAQFPAPVLSSGRLVPAVRLGAYVRDVREQIDAGIYDGNLTENVVLNAQLAEILTKKPVLNFLSPTKIDRYIKSPIGFFFGDILGIEEPKEYRDLLDPEEKGNIIHEILAHFYTKNSKYAPDWPLYDPAESPHQAKDRLTLIFSNLIQEKKHLFENVKSPFFRKLKEDLSKTIIAWLKEEQNRERNLKFFADYKPAPLSEVEALQFSPELDLELPIGGTNSTLKLKIDRIDIKNGDEKDVVVIDYKTGNVDSFTRKAVVNGMLSQMPLYLWAISEKTGLPPGGAFYWGIKPGNRFLDKTSSAVLADNFRIPSRSKPQQLQPDDVISIPVLFVEDRLKWIINAVKEGRFNQPLELVEYAPFELLSRTQNRVQEMRKKKEMADSKHLHADGKLGNWYCEVSLLGKPVSLVETEDAI